MFLLLRNMKSFSRINTPVSYLVRSPSHDYMPELRSGQFSVIVRYVLSSFSLTIIYSQPDTDMLICASDEALSGHYYAPDRNTPKRTTPVSILLLYL